MKFKQTLLMLTIALGISTSGIAAEKSLQQQGYSQQSTATAQQDIFTRSATTTDDLCWLYWNGQWYYIC
jgi:hypothetical protein